MTFHVELNRSASGGASVSQQEYNNLQACQQAGEYFKKHLVPSKLELSGTEGVFRERNYVYKDFACVPKGGL